MKPLFLVVTVATFAWPLLAFSQGLSLEFRESAPTDSFTIINTSACTVDANVVIDLTSSQGRLIFDTTAKGAGVEVFQPFEIVSGAEFVAKIPNINDGDKSALIALQGLSVGGKVVFTIDLDDTLPNSSLGQIRVAGSEIAGARVSVTTNATFSGKFDDNAHAQITMNGCPTS